MVHMSVPFNGMCGHAPLMPVPAAPTDPPAPAIALERPPIPAAAGALAPAPALDMEAREPADARPIPLAPMPAFVEVGTGELTAPRPLAPMGTELGAVDPALLLMAAVPAVTTAPPAVLGAGAGTPLAPTTGLAGGLVFTPALDDSHALRYNCTRLSAIETAQDLCFSCVMRKQIATRSARRNPSPTKRSVSRS